MDYLNQTQARAEIKRYRMDAERYEALMAAGKLDHEQGKYHIAQNRAWADELEARLKAYRAYVRELRASWE
jgi:hypothetical protein